MDQPDVSGHETEGSDARDGAAGRWPRGDDYRLSGEATDARLYDYADVEEHGHFDRRPDEGRDSPPV